MTPVEALHLTTFLASVYPSRMREEPTTRNWHAVFADVDATDALLAVILLARRHCDITAGDICAEAHRIGAQRLTRQPPSDTHSDGPWHYRTKLLDVVTALMSLRVPCSWCGATPGQPCTLRGSGIPLRKTPAHPARLVAVGRAGRETGGRERLGQPIHAT